MKQFNGNLIAAYFVYVLMLNCFRRNELRFLRFQLQI